MTLTDPQNTAPDDVHARVCPGGRERPWWPHPSARGCGSLPTRKSAVGGGYLTRRVAEPLRREGHLKNIRAHSLRTL
jgi:hypothetical protein